VLCLGSEIPAALVLPDEGGALEARQEERWKDACVLGAVDRLRGRLVMHDAKPFRIILRYSACSRVIDTAYR
jgi:hypothetical protein